jgi:hypothetical protein
MRFRDFVATCAERAFMFDSLRYLNRPSNLTGHDHPNKPANGGRAIGRKTGFHFC